MIDREKRREDRNTKLNISRLENGKSFLGELKTIFHNYLRLSFVEKMKNNEHKLLSFKTQSSQFFIASRAYFIYWGHGCIFRAHLLQKRTFCLLAPLKQMPFLTISNENVFFKI